MVVAGAALDVARTAVLISVGDYVVSTARSAPQERSARDRALATALVQARKAAGLTRREPAAKLKRSHSFVWKIEPGERRVDVLEFIELARYLDVEPAKLLERALQ
jgi:hypothetical protein